MQNPVEDSVQVDKKEGMARYWQTAELVITPVLQDGV